MAAETVETYTFQPAPVSIFNGNKPTSPQSPKPQPIKSIAIKPVKGK